MSYHHQLGTPLLNISLLLPGVLKLNLAVVESPVLLILLTLEVVIDRNVLYTFATFGCSVGADTVNSSDFCRDVN